MAAPNYIAKGNILPSSIVTQAGQTDFGVIMATSATVPLCGVAQDGTWYAPGLLGSDSYAAHTGQEIRVFGIGDECLCVADTTITVNNLIKPASSGYGTPVLGTETTTTYYVGRALEGTTGANILFRLVVNPGLYHT